MMLYVMELWAEQKEDFHIKTHHYFCLLSKLTLWIVGRVSRDVSCLSVSPTVALNRRTDHYSARKNSVMRQYGLVFFLSVALFGRRKQGRRARGRGVKAAARHPEIRSASRQNKSNVIEYEKIEIVSNKKPFNQKRKYFLT